MTSEEIRKQKKRIYQGRAEDQQAKAKGLLPTLVEEVAKLEKRVTGLFTSFVDGWETWKGKGAPDDLVPHVDESVQRNARYYVEGALLAAVLDAGYNAWVAPDVLNFNRYLAIAVGMFVGFVLAMLTAAVRGTRFREGEPQSSIESLQKFVGVIVTISVTSLAALLALRFYPLPLVLNIVLSLLGVSLPVAAGGLFYLSRKLNQLNDLANDWSRNDDELRSTQAFLEDLGNFVRVQPVPDSKSASIPVASDPSRVVPVANAMIVLALFLIMTVRSAGAQARIVDELHISPDQSGSLAPAEYGRVLKVLATSIDVPLADRWNDVRHVELLPWAGALQAWSGTSYRFDLPPPPHIEPFVPPAQRQIFTNAKNALIADARQDYEKAAAVKLQAYEREFRTVLRRVSAAILALDPNAHANQTCVYDIVLRALMENPGTVSIIVSDAEPWACGPRRTAISVGHEAVSPEVFFILVPGRDDGDAAMENMQQRVERLRREFPTVRVVRSFQVNDTWKWIN